jgi:hypothetical protein
MGSALAAYARANGWSRDELAVKLGMSTGNLAALYCERRPVATTTPGGGVFFEDGLVRLLAGRFDGNNDRVVEAFKEGASLFALEQR